MKLMALTLLTMITTAFGQAGQYVAQGSLLGRARSGDWMAVEQMDQRDDLEDLRTLVHDPKYQAKGAIRLRLARLGDHDSLQFFACQSLTDAGGSFVFMQDVLDYIRGEFAVTVYRRLLDSDERFKPPLEEAMKKCAADKKSMDCVPSRLPSISALYELPKLLPEASIPVTATLGQRFGNEDDGLKAKWRTWIDGHQSELEKLQPTAEGISFDSDYCAKFHEGPTTTSQAPISRP